MWKDLSIKEKAALINIGVKNGLYDLEDIKSIYNKYAEGGPLDYERIKESDKKYQEWKHNLPSNLRKETNDYDLYGAYKAGLQPNLEEDGYYHLGSRDPNTNRILKKPTHPTYLKAIIGDIHEGYYPVTKDNETYTLPFPNKYETGGYKPSSRIKKQITEWEGSTMKVNRSFEDEARDFNYSLPKGATSKLSQSQLDGLYSYSYNVGAGRFRQRVKPVLTKYLNGEATIQDVQKSMWASKDSQLRGLAKRRNVERSMFGGNYQSPLRDNLVTQNLIQSLPSVYDYKPPVIPQIKYTPDPSIIDNLTEEYTGIPEIMDRPVEVNPADNFLKVYNLLNNIRR